MVLAPEVEDQDLIGGSRRRGGGRACGGRLGCHRLVADEGRVGRVDNAIGGGMGNRRRGGAHADLLVALQLLALRLPSDGATITSALWKAGMSSYPQVAIDVRRLPIRLKVPSFSCAGPSRSAPWSRSAWS